MNLFVSALLFLFSGAMLASCQSENQQVDTTCMACICEAASRCNLTLGCTGNMCGLFRITYPYWSDAGKPVIDSDDPDSADAWVRCVTEPYCAARTVQGYLDRFKQDCNGDGRIDCFDFASIHHLGGYGCNSRPWDRKFENQFRECMDQIRLVAG